MKTIEDVYEIFHKVTQVNKEHIRINSRKSAFITFRVIFIKACLSLRYINIDLIADFVNKDRTTIYYYRDKDLIDWEEETLNKIIKKLHE